MKRKFVAILAADVCGYTRLVAEDEERTVARLLSDRALFGDIVGRRGGRVFNTAGDAVLAEFPGPADAVLAASEIQRSVGALNAAEPAHPRMRYRIGITVGDVVDRDGDLLGDGVNVASRLEGLAEPGGICLSRAARDGLDAPLSLACRDMGRRTLKNFPQRVHAFMIPASALGDVAASPVRSGRRFAGWAGVACVLAAVVGVVVVSIPPRPGRTAAADAVAPQPQTFVFGPDLQPPAEPRIESHPAFNPDLIPFVGDAGRARIAVELAKGGSSAVALANRGVFGVASGADSPAHAEADALRDCFAAEGTNCRLFAVDGEVVWAEPLPPLPPAPWVDPAAPRTPFDADRIGGLKGGERRRIAQSYAGTRGHAALALGARGAWASRVDRATAEEAERLALESCGAFVGAPCRIVAVDGSFVVPPRAP